MIVYHLEANGRTNTGVYVKNICESIRMKGDRVRVFTSRSSMHDKREVPVFGGYGQAGRKLVKLAWYALGWCRIFVVLSRIGGKKILHSHWLKFSPVDFICLNLLKLFFGDLVLIHTVHNIMPHEKSFFDPWFFKRIYPIFDWLIFHSQRTVADYETRYGSLQTKHSIVPHFGYDTPREGASPVQSRSILFFGYIRRYKGLEFLLDVLSRIDPEVDFFLTVAGKPEYNIDSAVKKVAQSHLAGKVRWKTDWIEEEELADLFRSHSIAVLPYDRVDSSGALTMAMGYGKIVIASNVGAFADVIRHNENGILFAPGSEDSLYEALKRVLSDVGEYARLGRNARRKIREDHSKEAIGGKITDIYFKAAGYSEQSMDY